MAPGMLVPFQATIFNKSPSLFIPCILFYGNELQWFKMSDSGDADETFQ